MAYLTCKLKSEALASTTTVRVFLPSDLAANAGQPLRGVMTLLHGITNDGDDWANNSAVLRYAAACNLALIIPDGANSFYNDMAFGSGYYTWMTEELPALLGGMFRLPPEREKHAVCGLSMGGYGALLLGLTQPGQYAHCASFSGGVDLASVLAQKDHPLVSRLFQPVFGQQLQLPPERDLFRLAEQVSKLNPAQQPQILCTVGTEDHEPYYIYEQNQNLRAHFERLPLNFTYMEWPGAHEWEFWDRSVAIAIDRFFCPGFAARQQQSWTSPIHEEKAHG